MVATDADVARDRVDASKGECDGEEGDIAMRGREGDEEGRCVGITKADLCRCTSV